jgi:UDP:flavonoid glycosyltransferase YjiC (YdhE family)
LSADENLLTLTEDASALGRAVRDLLRDPSYRESAQRLSREIHAADSPRSLAARLAGMI